MLLQPLLRIFTKPSTAAMQTVLHALFLPTPFKVLSQSSAGTSEEQPKGAKGSLIDPVRTDMPEEVLKPGALYADCAAVRLRVPLPSSAMEQLATEQEKNNDKGKGKDKSTAREEVLEIQDDGELGGEMTGRLVWEAYEEALKGSEKANLANEEGREVVPDVDQDCG